MRIYKCKCKHCGNELTTDKAFCIQGKFKQYYCSKEEYEEILKEQQIKGECMNYVAEIMGMKFTPPAMIKLVNGLNEFYSYMVIKRAFKDNKESIIWALGNKTFNSEYAKYKYVTSIVLNNIDRSYKSYLREQKELENLFNKTNTNSIDVEILNFDRNEMNSGKNSDISMFLED